MQKNSQRPARLPDACRFGARSRGLRQRRLWLAKNNGSVQIFFFSPWISNILVGSALFEFLEADISAGFLAFFEETLANEFGEMGIVMPEIDWGLVAHAGNLNEETEQVVADQNLMGTLTVRYLARIAAMEENRDGFRALVGSAVPSFFSGHLSRTLP